jgi:hypothetical protein
VQSGEAEIGVFGGVNEPRCRVDMGAEWLDAVAEVAVVVHGLVLKMRVGYGIWDDSKVCWRRWIMGMSLWLGLALT